MHCSTVNFKHGMVYHSEIIGFFYIIYLYSVCIIELFFIHLTRLTAIAMPGNLLPKLSIVNIAAALMLGYCWFVNHWAEHSGVPKLGRPVVQCQMELSIRKIGLYSRREVPCAMPALNHHFVYWDHAYEFHFEAVVLYTSHWLFHSLYISLSSKSIRIM